MTRFGACAPGVRGRIAVALTAAAATMACGQAAAPTGERYLVIGASDTSPQRIAFKALALADGRASGTIVNVADCGDARPLFAWVSEVATSAETAKAAVERLKPRVPDAYVKPCKVQPGSLLALGVSAVDPSIGKVPANAVNWSDEDRVSSVVAIGAAGRLVLSRHYQHAPDDPLEGRRTRVSLATPVGRLIPLVDDCPGAGQFAQTGSWLAFACDTEQAGDHVLHTVRAFSTQGAAAGTVPRCRQPAIAMPDMLSCQAEEVDADGKLKLQVKTLRLAAR